MKIGIVSYAFPQHRRGYWIGVERSLEEISKAFIRGGNEIYVFTSFCLGGKMYEVTDYGAHIIRASSIDTGIMCANLISFSHNVLRLYHRLLNKMDVVHVFVYSLVPSGLPRGSRPPLVAHSFHFDRADSLIMYSWLPMLRRLARSLFDLSDLVTIEHELGTAEWAQYESFYKLDANKMKFAPCEGVNLEKFNPRVSGERVKKKFIGRIVLTVGPLVKRKAIHYFIEAATIILREYPDISFIIIGKGPDLPRLKRLTKRLGIERKVFFEGFVPDEFMPCYYKAAEVFVFPSIQEGFPCLPLEPMACGTPVVSSNLANMKTIVGNGGILVQPSDVHGIAKAVIRMLEDPEMREKLSNEAYKAAKKFTWDKAAEKIFQIYKEAIEVKSKS